MMPQFQQSDTTQPLRFFLRDAAADPVTGANPTITFRKSDETLYAAALGAVTELSGGEYSWAGHADDRDTLGLMQVKIEAAGAETLVGQVAVVGHDPYGLPSAAEVNAAVEAGAVGVDAAAGRAAAESAGGLSGVVDDAAPGSGVFGISGVPNLATGAYEEKFLEVGHGDYRGEARRIVKTTLVAGVLVVELERDLPGAVSNGGVVRLVGAVA